jgi:S-adenosylmethionine:tRNA ribosyltransferase-isomerase
MKTSELEYDLPQELIAQEPARRRSDSRLLVLERASGAIYDRRFSQIADFLRAGDCLVLNDTKVLQARVYGRRKTGAGIKGLFLRQVEVGLWEMMIKCARRLKPGETFFLEGRGHSYKATLMEKRQSGTCVVRVEGPEDFEAVLDRIGFPPLPPYIRRDADAEKAEADRRRYQTVYARRPGAVAAPTAGLHFTNELLEELAGAGVKCAKVTLHVGAGTFKPVSAEDMRDHEMHSEWYTIDESNAAVINETKLAAGRVIAVGTTSVRTLETMAVDNMVRAGSGETKLFILPGYEFKVVDAMVTNFHLPRSTLLALVAAFAGLEKTLAAYRYAVEEKYRFYSYGDAMLII